MTPAELLAIIGASILFGGLAAFALAKRRRGRSRPVDPGDALAASPILAAEWVPEPSSLRTTPLDLAEPDRLHLFAAASRLPAFGVPARELAGKTFLMTLDPRAAREVSLGRWSMMQSRATPGAIRGDVVDGAGRVRGQASWAQLSKAPAAAAAVWQVLAVVTAQKFLADIDEKLGALKTGVDEVREFLEGERDARLRGNLDYLVGLARDVSSGRLGDVSVYLGQLEAVERETLQVASHLAAAAEAEVEKLRTWSAPRDGEEAVADLDGAISRFGRASGAYLFACGIRAAAAQVRIALPIAKERGERILESVLEDVGRQETQRELFFRAAADRAGGVAARFSWRASRVAAAKHALRETRTTTRRALAASARGVSRSALAVRDRVRAVEANGAEASLVVTLNARGEPQTVATLLARGDPPASSPRP